MTFELIELNELNSMNKSATLLRPYFFYVILQTVYSDPTVAIGDHHSVGICHMNRWHLSLEPL